jgi:hypothetical protein
VCSPDPSMHGGVAPGNTIPAPRFLGAMDSGVLGLGLLCSSGSPSPPVCRGQVENSAEQACSWVAAADRLLREVMAMVGRDIMHPIQVS